MPDWFYRTVAQRVLFQLPERASRAVALGVIGTLGRSAPGRALIELLGHMQAHPALAVRVGGVEFPSPVGLGWRVDPERRATRGLACFGVGCIETFDDAPGDVLRWGEAELQDGEKRSSAQRRAQAPPASGSLPALRRWSDASGGEWVRWPNEVDLPVVAWTAPTGSPVDLSRGLVLQVGVRLPNGGWRVPAEMPAALPASVRAWRALLPPGAPLLVAGGMDKPGHLLALLAAGANLVLIDGALVFRGPGLVKRCHEALIRLRPETREASLDEGLFRSAWFWGAALGSALVLGGGAALVLAATRVLLPYDEHYLGVTAEVLRRNSPRLFAFMAHDRGTLAGTMLALGWFYLVLAWHGVRRGRHGTRTTVVMSALAGFASFFAFFGFGYFDTLHAFVACVLFQITVQIMTGREGGAPAPRASLDEEDSAWRCAQWGQLLWVIHSAGLLAAGALILGIGMSSVFVAEDLAFLCVTEAQVRQLGEKMIGVVAHDRATLGGMLLASGVAMLLSVLWRFRRGESWLWTGMAGLGALAYLPALGVHCWVGYTDWRHMLPAQAGLALWLGGLGLSFRYLRGHSRED